MSTTPATIAPPRAYSPLILSCLAATWLIWGSTYLVIRFALAGFAPYFMMATRFVFAGGLLLAWQLARGAPLPSLREWRNALLIGTLMLGGGMGGVAYAEQTIASGLVVAFIAVIPLLLVVINLAFGVHPKRSELLAVLVGLGGVLMLTQGAGIRASPTGLAAITVGTTGWALGSVLAQRGFALAAGATGFATEMLCGGLALLLMSAVRGEAWHWPIETDVWLAWWYLVVFGSLIAFSAYMLLLARTSATLAASYSLVNPVVAMLLGTTLGGETVSAWEWFASGIVMIGVVLLFAGRRRQHSAPSTS
ncbi:MAG TPA: EamA family transporter [Steroidobacteraceae bacterium]|nr:EamA family transporter [Steroidobacteraceae bacterium]